MGRRQERGRLILFLAGFVVGAVAGPAAIVLVGMALYRRMVARRFL